MEKEILKNLIDENLTTYGIAEKLDIGQTTVRYWLRKYGLNTHGSTHTPKTCQVCSVPLKGKQQLYCSKLCKGEQYTTNPNDYLTQQKRAIERKLFFIHEKGGKCEICGYAKNIAALVFHHTDPSNKTFTIDSRKCSNTNMESLKREVEKCQLLCCNCHAEIHNPTLEMVLAVGLEPTKGFQTHPRL